MSSIPVNNNLNVLANIVNQMPSASDARTALSDRQGEMMKDTFDMVMSRVSSVADTKVNDQASKLSVAADSKAMSADIGVSGSSDKAGLKSNETQSLQKSKETDGAADSTAKEDSDKTVADQTTSDKEVSDKEVSDKEKDAVNETGEKLVEEVANEMGVDIDEVIKAMEILGLTAVQLFDPENMKQLLITLSGNEDNLSIITDGELYGHLQNMFEMIETELADLQTELGLTEEELNTLIADMVIVEKALEEENVMEEIPELSDDEPEVNLEGMKDYSVMVHKDGETVEVKVKVDDVSGEQTSKEQVQATTETQTKPENKSQERNLFGEDKEDNKGNAHTAGNFVTQNPIEQPNFNEIPQQPVLERYVSTEDIMNQIMESLKINLKGDVQELEMHLHPASLGNVHVQIAAKEGMLTAQFVAQNETVKAAIESQLVQLKEQFEEQGIKVDEVEVTVGNYRFDHSFAGDEEGKQENAENGKKSRRNINLDELDLDDLPEDMDDSEKLAAEMMALHGNSVDYTA
ncbi:MAG: flagellar hook-length control protein FliK [Lachnospiraceae bacterium]|nr:flagellar hook-length control protein FliK [Lachnospiraceae bacterium]